jgi:NAD+ synthase (glutamine-hydrolysing)
MFGQLRLALAQINPTVGDIVGNCRLVESAVALAAEQGAHLVVFPEMVITGYPVEDLALRQSFRDASTMAISSLATSLAAGGYGEMVLFVGYLAEDVELVNRVGRPQGAPQNAVAVIHEGVIKASYVKRHLPNYGVFDEFRNFVPGNASLIVRIHGVDVGVAICEDIWQEGGTVTELRDRRPGLVVVPNGSPYERNKDDLRLALVRQRVSEIDATIAYVNMTGGQDDLVFDGDTIVVGVGGKILARAPQFNDTLLIVDLELKAMTSKPDLILSGDIALPYSPLTSEVATRLDDHGEVWAALVVGLRDYVAKNNFKTVLVAISGGIDSALVASIAVDALGAENVFGVSLPSKFSSKHSLTDAEELATNTGLHYRVIEIEPMVGAFHQTMYLEGLAQENVQARVRGVALMGISNQEGHLVLATGNKSELAVGYSTLYGDAVGAFAPIKDIYKTDVWALAKWRNEQARLLNGVAPIPENSITKEPSAELRPGQKDSDSLPDYILLDEVLMRYVEGDEGGAALIASGLDASLVNRVITLVDRAEYKRRQYPPGPKVSSRAFGKDRRLPITSRWNEGSH